LADPPPEIGVNEVFFPETLLKRVYARQNINAICYVQKSDSNLLCHHLLDAIYTAVTIGGERLGMCISLLFAICISVLFILAGGELRVQ